ncbi:hypothetical protein RU639_003876 [Aspergillus parasiticus]
MKPSHFKLENAIRPNIYALPKYITSTSDEFQARSKILLDANENSLGTCLAPPAKSSNGCDPNELLGYIFASTMSLNRYPSASQAQLKSRIAESRKEFEITKDMICLGTGAADVIDLLLRVTCRPGKDAILVTPPTFGLYKVRAAFQEAEVISCPLDESFNLQVDHVHKELEKSPNVKLVFLASPGNPTGTLIPLEDIKAVLDHSSLKGYVVVDEAYIDYTNCPDKATALNLLSEYANLIVVQTLSKGAGLAGIRLGIAFAQPETIGMLDKLQMPYCIPTPTSILAQAALSPDGRRSQKRLVEDVIANRESLVQALAEPSTTKLGVGKPLGAGEANFVVLPILNRATTAPDRERAQLVEKKMQENHSISIRYIGMMAHCDGCLRITVGTEDENKQFVEGLRTVLSAN